MAQVFSLAQVADHNTRDDFWLTVFGKVYNVTTFLDEHPGGDEILLKTTGRDATKEFDDVGHSHEAWALLEKYYVGELDRATVSTTESATASSKNVNKKNRKKVIFNLVKFLVPMIILNVIIALFSKSSS